jgi:hypothetical protein
MLNSVSGIDTRYWLKRRSHNREDMTRANQAQRPQYAPTSACIQEVLTAL